MATVNLVQELRGRIRDSKSQLRAFGVSVSDSQAADVFLEVRGGRLKVTVHGGTAPSVDLNLSNPLYDTSEKVVRALASMSKYVVSKDEDMDEGFSSISFSEVGPVSIKGNQADVTHKMFSDVYLGDILRRAVLQHNPSLSLEILPDGEAELVLTRAQALLYRELAGASAKRRGMDMTSTQLLELAESLDKSYRMDMTRLARAIQSPREASPNIMREGDVVIGTFTKRLRSGRMRPAGNIPPEQPVLLDPTDIDVEDTSIHLDWQSSAAYNFGTYEVWRDTVPTVARGRGAAVRATTERSGYVETTGGCISGLEPETTYYFRLYVVDRNGESTGSQVIQATTLELRSRLSKTAPPTPTTVYAGDTVTLTFDPIYTAPSMDLRIQLGEKTISPATVVGNVVTFVVPAFFQKGLKDLRVISPNGLSDTFKSIYVY